ncbi:WD repeat-containing protein 25 [Hoplias malabaricus]|uniref:WD repeat-containing protein 25 n=1 Tax=Hoplias malabaricus TaxID=27720 RepID=UPI0034627DE0
MNSLVDYDDSDSEEVLPGKNDSSPESEEEKKQRKSRFILNSHLHYDKDKTALCAASSVPSNHASHSWRHQRTTEYTQQPSSFPAVQSSKRHQPIPAGLRPYVSKKQKLTTPTESAELNKEGSSSSQVSDVHHFSELSDRIRPFLGTKKVKRQLPRYVQHHLQAHKGPVNTVQWCPVPHLSHLLLSASMDKTFKVWDGAESGRCLQTYSIHSGAVRDVCWLPCGQRLLSGSFDNAVAVTDVETGQIVTKVENQFKVSCLAFQPSDPSVVLCGGFSPEVKAWDFRSGNMVSTYRAGIQQTLDILFLGEGKEFVTSTDAVSRDSADRTLIAWDFRTTAKVSNQIFHERYTCPSLTLFQNEDSFAAQTNGNYIAIFSAQKPYPMNKRKRFEGHKVEGYAVQCEFSSDGAILASGSCTGSLHFYDVQSARSLLRLHAHQQACVSLSLHPVLPSVVATCDWEGEIKIWS